MIETLFKCTDCDRCFATGAALAAHQDRSHAPGKVESELEWRRRLAQIAPDEDVDDDDDDNDDERRVSAVRELVERLNRIDRHSAVAIANRNDDFLISLLCAVEASETEAERIRAAAEVCSRRARQIRQVLERVRGESRGCHE